MSHVLKHKWEHLREKIVPIPLFDSRRFQKRQATVILVFVCLTCSFRIKSFLHLNRSLIPSEEFHIHRSWLFKGLLSTWFFRTRPWRLELVPELLLRGDLSFVHLLRSLSGELSNPLPESNVSRFYPFNTLALFKLIRLAWLAFPWVGSAPD